MDVPFYTAARIRNVSQQIPAKIFQTWKTRQVSPEVYNVIQDLIAKNPEYDYYFFSDQDCRDYLLKHFGQSYVDAFNEIKPGAFKADFWRYAVLSREGGVYIDLDMKLLEPLKQFIDEQSSLFLVRDRPDGGIYQAFLATVPGHPLMLTTLEQCLHNIQQRSMGDWESSLSITGPLMMGEVYNYLNDKPRRSPIESPDGHEQIGAFNGEYVILDGRQIIKGKIEEYTPQTNYGAAFAACNVYKHQHRGGCIYRKYSWQLLLTGVVLFTIYMYMRYRKYH